LEYTTNTIMPLLERNFQDPIHVPVTTAGNNKRPQQNPRAAAICAPSFVLPSLPFLRKSNTANHNNQNTSSNKGRNSNTDTENNNENSQPRKSSETLEVDIDIQQYIEDQKYDDLLDELLSDDANRSPKSELLDDLDLIPSPTFQGFWNSGDDEDEEEDNQNNEAVEEIDEYCDDDEEAVDDNDEYCAKEDIEQLSRLIDEIDIVASSSSDMYGPKESDKNEEIIESDVNTDFLDYMAEQPSFSPSHREETPPCLTGDTLPSESELNLALKEINEKMATLAPPRMQFEVIEHDLLNLRPPTNIDNNFPDRRLSTGCIAESSSRLSFDFGCDQDDVHVDANEENEQIDAASSTSETETEDSPVKKDEDAMEVKPSTSASSTEASQSIAECKYAATPGMEFDLLGNEANADNEDSIKLNPSESTETSDSRSRAIENIQVETVTSITSETANEIVVSLTRVDCSDTVDPYEWAYNVWRRKGLMAGSPMNARLQGIASASSTESSQTSKGKATAVSSYNTKNTNARGSESQLRRPKDRRSLPAKMPELKTQTKPARNGAGFNILLSRWKDKSEGNSDLISPRARSPVHTSIKQKVTSLQTMFNQGEGEKDKETEIEIPPVRKTTFNNDTAPDINCSQVPENAEIDITPVLSPSRRRKANGPVPKNDFDNDVAPEINSSQVPENAEIDITPVLSPSRRRMKKSQVSIGNGNMQGKGMQEQNVSRTPSKNKNSLTRYLPQTKYHTVEKSIEVHALGGGHQVITDVIDETCESFVGSPPNVQELVRPMQEITPLTTRSKCDERSVTSASTIPFFSPSDDTLVEPRGFNRRRHTSDRSTSSKKTTSSVRTPVPCREIFVMNDQEDRSIVSGMYTDDVRSVATESNGPQSEDPHNERMHFTNLQDLLQTRADSMSFDSKSEVTHITFRTETRQNLGSKVNAMTNQTLAPTEETTKDVKKDLNVTFESDENEEPPSRATLIAEMGMMTGATRDYSERPWRKDLLVRNVTTAMDKATASKFECDCDYSLAMFSAKDEMVDFFLPLIAVSCSCRKSKKLVKQEDPYSLENILRPWQISFLRAFGILHGDQLVKAHHRSARYVFSRFRSEK